MVFATPPLFTYKHTIIRRHVFTLLEWEQNQNLEILEKKIITRNTDFYSSNIYFLKIHSLYLPFQLQLTFHLLHILMHTHSYLPYITRLPWTCLSNFPYFQLQLQHVKLQAFLVTVAERKKVAWRRFHARRVWCHLLTVPSSELSYPRCKPLQVIPHQRLSKVGKVKKVSFSLR